MDIVIVCKLNWKAQKEKISDPATKCLKIVDNIETILAIELMNASQALAFRNPKKSSQFIEQFDPISKRKARFYRSHRKKEY